MVLFFYLLKRLRITMASFSFFLCWFTSMMYSVIASAEYKRVFG